jgi:transposase
VLGIDDFALRHSRSYATVLIDAETGRRADVLPGRIADIAEAWLRDHPGVEIVCRDGSGAYGEAARRAVRSGPVSDRWQSGPRPTSSTSATASAWSPTTAAR